MSNYEAEQCLGDCGDDCAKCASDDPRLWCDACRDYDAEQVTP